MEVNMKRYQELINKGINSKLLLKLIEKEIEDPTKAIQLFLDLVSTGDNFNKIWANENKRENLPKEVRCLFL